MADPLGGIVDLAAEIDRVVKSLRRGVLLRSSKELAHVAELAAKIQRAARIAMEDVELLEKAIGEAHDAIDGLAPEVGQAPAGSPKTRIDWVKKRLAKVLGDLHEATDKLTAELGWPRAPAGSPQDRIGWITKQLKQLKQRGQG